MQYMSRIKPINWDEVYLAASRKKKKRKRKYGKLSCPSSLEQLRRRCLASIEDYNCEGDVHDTPDGQYIFKDNGASVLAVAHLDVVQPHARHFGHRKGAADKVYNCQLDDRLGAHIILDLLPAMGISVDVLLTEGEESCRSTAAHFQTSKDYNWLIEFDRAGGDVVMYDYETPELTALLEGLGNCVNWGSYSDISVLGDLGVAGFNWGIGYHNGHSNSSYFSRAELQEALQRFAVFWAAHKDTEFPYVEVKKNPRGHSVANGRWEKESWEEAEIRKQAEMREEWEEEEFLKREEREFAEAWERYKDRELEEIR